MQSWFNIKKANKVIHRVNQLKKKKDIIPIQAEKAYDKILSWTPIHDKNFLKTRNGGRILNMVKNIYKKPTAGTFNGEKLNAFPQGSGKARMSTLYTAIKRSTEILASTIRQGRK